MNKKAMARKSKNEVIIPVKGSRGDSHLIWHTESRVIDDLVPWSKNPRKMDEMQEQDLRKSLERLNLMSIPVVNTDNTVVSGHQRIRILQAMGRGKEMIDVRVPNRPLTTEEMREANLRENKNLGDWDWDLLASFNGEELLRVGFSDDQLAMEFGLKDTELEELNVETSQILQIDPPESVKIKERAVIYFDSKKDYDRAKNAVLKKKINAASILSLLS